ncbi:MAG: major capsid protein P2 [Steroidobacteraceae bacterium]
MADITEIRILVNGPVFQRFSGAQRDVMNKFDGRAPRDHRRNQLPARDPL